MRCNGTPRDRAAARLAENANQVDAMFARVRQSGMDIPRCTREVKDSRMGRSAMVTLDAAHTCTLVATGDTSAMIVASS